MARLVLLLVSIATVQMVSSSGGVDMERPRFLQEPPSRLVFSNMTGAQVSCTASGRPSPRVSWLLRDGTLASAVPGLRQILSNGTLYFPPFAGSEFRADVHSASYRCLAAGPSGALLSRDMRAHAVVRGDFQPRISRANVLEGNTGVLNCELPSGNGDHISVMSWYRDDTLILPNTIDNGERIVMAMNGHELHVRDARPADSIPSYSCIVRDSLTGDRRRSEPGHLTVSEPSGSVPPRLVSRPPAELTVMEGKDVELTCIAHGNPPPSVTWYRETGGRREAVVGMGGSGGTSGRLMLRGVTVDLSGRWACRAASPGGEQTAVTTLSVMKTLAVSLDPSLLVVNSGGAATLNCSVDGGAPGGDFEWAREGRPLAVSGNVRRLVPSRLLLNGVRREETGLYQCFVRRGLESAQATAEVRLGDTIPEMVYTFIEQALRPGPPVSLRCSASGAPPPRFTWLLDNQPLQELLPTHRFSIGQYVERTGDVISHLNISSARAEDGGLYTCRASNSIGETEHSARLNIYGPPYIRFVAPQRAVAGSNITIYCPYSGYPISGVKWERQGIAVGTGLRHGADDEGGLRVYSVSPTDGGAYTCSVASPAGELARRDLQLIVLKPPQLAPFVFPSNVEEGSNIQATCSVMSGDRPIYFSWFKDNLPIPALLDVEQRSVEFFSLLIIKEVSSAHSGTYTCVASNSAAKANYSSQLVVRVAPQWIFEPQDISTLIGTPMNVHCAARGFPTPQISWMKGQGQTSQNYQPLDQLDLRPTIILDNGTLSIQSASPHDEGHYLCKATNDIGPGLSKAIVISVNEPPRFEHGSKNISTRRSDSATLICEVFGDNPIQVIWTHNMNRLDANNYRLIISEAKTESGMRSQLSVRQADRQDSGLYKCQAENAFGRSELVIYLAVQERPDPPASLEVVEVGSRLVRLAWRRPFDGNSPVLSYLVQHRPMPQAADWDSALTTNFTIPARPRTEESIEYNGQTGREQAVVGGLHPASTYVLRMLAINQIDQSSYTDSVVAKTQEEAPLDPPRNVQVQTAGPGELLITWQAPPREKWNGELLGYTVRWQEASANGSLVIAGLPISSVGTAASRVARVSGWANCRFTATGLAKFTRYAVSVTAFNSVAAGPASVPAFATTLEGVPEAPPEDIACVSLSSQGIKVSWRPPPLMYHGGVIQGYKVHFRPMQTNDNMEQWSESEIKRAAGHETQLHALRPYTTYALQLRAYTSAGDGAPSNPIHCTTDEDVPAQPNGIKALSLSSESILVSWLPPLKPNGHIKHYTIYVREATRSGKPMTYTVLATNKSATDGPLITSGEMTFEVGSLKDGKSYEVWVSATTGSGEGEPTAIVNQEPSSRGPARIASFGGPISAGAGAGLSLSCRAVGIPSPRTLWMRAGAPITHHRALAVTQQGDLLIPKIDASLSDNFTCAARNSGGEDSVTYSVRVLLPPPPPSLVALPTPTQRALAVRLETPQHQPDTTPAHGYTLNYKHEESEWRSLELAPDSTTFTLQDLRCGSLYHMYVTAHNRVGSGNPSDVITASTRGGVPKAPTESEFLSTNSTTLRLNGISWDDSGCPPLRLSCEYRPLGSARWIPAGTGGPDPCASIEAGGSDPYAQIGGLVPATWYQLRVTAVNEAGVSVADFNFATTTLSGARIAAPSSYPDEGVYADESFTDSIVLLILCAAITVSAIIMAYLLLKKRRQDTPAEDKSEEDNCRNCQQVYTALPLKHNGKSLDDSSELYEISPYATFNVAGGGQNHSQGHSQNHPQGPGGQGPIVQGSRAVTAATLDYTLQFRTFGHTENDAEGRAAPAPPPPPANCIPAYRPARLRHKQRCYHSNDEESSMSTAETVRVGRRIGMSNNRPPPDSDSDDSVSEVPMSGRVAPLGGLSAVVVPPAVRCSHRQRPTRLLHHADTEM